MKKWSRKTKLAVCLLIFLTAATLIVSVTSWRSPTAEVAFRRAEKRHLVGPGEIMETLSFEHSSYDHLLVAKSGYGYTFYEWSDSSGWDNGVLTYEPKEDGVTLYCTNYTYGSQEDNAQWLPIFAFAEDPSAVHARLTLQTTQNGETAVYSLEADRREAGYFLFSLSLEQLRHQDFWLIQQLIADQYEYYILDGTATVTIELFSSSGTLLESCHFAE